VRLYGLGRQDAKKNDLTASTLRNSTRELLLAREPHDHLSCNESAVAGRYLGDIIVTVSQYFDSR